MVDSIKLLPPRVDFLDPRTGKISREWYRFILDWFVQTGAESGIDVTDLANQITALGTELNLLSDEVDAVELRVDDVELVTQAIQAMTRPDSPTSGIVRRIDELEARLTSVERRSNTDDLRRAIEETRTYIFGAL